MLPHLSLKRYNSREVILMNNKFKDIRITDNFYQSSSFFPMPLTLIGTLNEDGSLNREKLGNIVFSDPQKKETLMDIVTSKVINIIDITMNVSAKLNTG